MDLHLSGKLALITGGSKGIGYACAKSLLAEGCNVHLVARNQAELAEAAQRLAANTQASISFTALDLSNSQNIATLLAAVPSPDILINNAGAIPGGAIDDVEETAWREGWELKVFGYINLTRCYNSAMKTRGQGVIINIIGIGGEKPSASYAAGAAGNAGLMALTRALGGASPSYGVRILGVNPGLIATDRLKKLMQPVAEAELGDAGRWRELLASEGPPGEPQHVADMVTFLASDRSANTSGTIITVDGGRCSR